MLLWRASLRFLTRHPAQCALAVSGIALGVAIVIGMLLTQASARQAFADSLRSVFGHASHLVVAVDGEDFVPNGKNLVIVESPGKVKTIAKVLGRNFIVKASIGHVRDLPKTKKESKGETIVLGVKRDFTPQYITLANKSKVIPSLRIATPSVFSSLPQRRAIGRAAPNLTAPALVASAPVDRLAGRRAR